MSIDDKDKKIKRRELDPDYEEINLEEVEKNYLRGEDGNLLPQKTHFWNINKKDILTIVIVIAVGTASYGLGKLSNIEKGRMPVQILDSKSVKAEILDAPTNALPEKENKNLNSAGAMTAVTSLKSDKAGMLVGSKTGKKYHYPWCSGAQRILPENKVWFESEAKAKESGYEPASNCKGLK